MKNESLKKKCSVTCSVTNDVARENIKTMFKHINSLKYAEIKNIKELHQAEVKKLKKRQYHLAKNKEIIAKIDYKDLTFVANRTLKGMQKRSARTLF